MGSNPDLSPVAREICAANGFRFVDEAGEGAFKQTFLVRGDADMPLALKVYNAGFHSERSDREIHAMRTCNHPNIARFYSLATFDMTREQYLYTIEEYLGGGTLAARIKQNGLFAAPSLKALGTLLIDAVGHIASHNFVHRDLKPDNIMFRQGTDIPVIVDFGLVRDLAATALTPEWLPGGPGTPYFAAPEQLNNDQELIDWRTDQFALGVLLSFSIFGRHPYEAGHPALIVPSVAQHSRPSPEFFADIERTGLEALITMVAPWPVQRYRTPEELAAAWRS